MRFHDIVKYFSRCAGAGRGHPRVDDADVPQSHGHVVCLATVQPGHATPVSQVSRDGKSRLLELPRSQRHWTGGHDLGRRSGGDGE